MDKYCGLGKRWIHYLKKRRLYSAWMNDVGAASNFSIRGVSFLSCSSSTFNVCNTNYYVLALNACKNYTALKHIVTSVDYLLHWPLYTRKHKSKIIWESIYNEFIKSEPPLSISLSRKLSRASKKKKTAKEWGEIESREKLEQPWYNKSYVKNYRNLWRK